MGDYDKMETIGITSEMRDIALECMSFALFFKTSNGKLDLPSEDLIAVSMAGIASDKMMIEASISDSEPDKQMLVRKTQDEVDKVVDNAAEKSRNWARYVLEGLG